MPTNLSFTISRSIPGTNPKRYKLTILLLLSPILFFGQSLTGLWTGALSNDSTTVRKDQLFEIALTEYKGKVYGYSRSEFIVDDTLYYVVKRVKGTIDGEVCEVTDEEIISYNFRGKLDKGIKVTSIFRRNQNDSSWYLEGTWKTNATKKYYAVTGKVNLEEEKDLSASKIFPHLEELNLADDIAFYKDRKEGPPIARMAKPEKIRTEYSTVTKPLLNKNDIAITPARPTPERAEADPPPVISIASVSSTSETNKPLITGQSSEKIVDISTTETDVEITAVTKPVADPLKTGTKINAAGSVTATPSLSTRTIAESKTPVTSASPAKADTDLAISSTNYKQIKQVSVTTTAKNEQASSISSVTDKKEIITGTIAKTTVKHESAPIKQPGNISTSTQADIKNVAKTNNPVIPNSTKAVTETKKQEIASTDPVKPITGTTTHPTLVKEEIKTAPVTASVIPALKKTEIDITTKSALIAGRKTEFSQIVSFKSDSLELSLYDNGEIDGDTVSIFMNGEVILFKQGLKASAIKKTIYITPGNEDFTLVLFADNLGKFPPNTGLLVVHDGDDVYNLRFSSDFQTNAGIVFRRKK